MPISMDVKSRFDVAAAELAARQAKSFFSGAANDISKSWSASMSSMFNRVDGSEARAGLKRLQEEYATTARVAQTAERDMVRSNGNVETSVARLHDALAKYGVGSSQVVAASNKVNDAWAASELAAGRHTDAAAAAVAAQQRVKTATEDAAVGLSAASRVFSGVGVGSLALLGGAMFETTKHAASFETAMTKMSASADLPADQAKAISDGILQMTAKVGYGADQLSGAMYLIQKANLEGASGAATAAEKLTVLKAAAQGAAVEQAPLEEVISALTTSLHDFNIPADQASGVMSKMVSAVGQSKVPLNDFAGALHTIEPTAAAAHISLEDLWGTLAQVTQSGTSADQAADQINNAIRSLSTVQGPARDAMQQLGIDVQDVTDKLGDGPGGRGFAGTMQYLSDKVMAHMADANHVNVGELRQAAQAQANANAMIAQMGPAAQAAAEGLANNTVGHREYQMVIRQANESDAVKLKQFQQLQDQVDGFGKKFSTGRSTLQTYNQTMNDLTGTMSGAQIALQTTGKHADETNLRIDNIAKTTAGADGSVKGFTETEQTLNQKMKDASAAFGAAAIEVGTAFIPVMTDVADVAKTVGDAMAKHPEITHAAITGLEALGGAWVGFKALGIAETILAPIATGLGTIIAGEEGATAAAAGMKTAMSMAGPIAAGVAIGAPIANEVVHNDTLRSIESKNPLAHNPISRWINLHTPSWLGGDTIDEHGDIKANAGGGVAGRTDAGRLWGPGTGTSDSILGVNEWGMPTARVSDGEGIVNVAAMRRPGVPQLVAGLNGYAGGTGAEAWRSTVADTVDRYGPQVGVTAATRQSWIDGIVKQIGIESGGNPNADNPNDSNGQGGRQHVAGLLQYLPSSYAMSGGRLTGLPYMDPVGQIAGALFAPRNADGSPAHLGQGGGWGPVATAINGNAAPLADRGFADWSAADTRKVRELEERVSDKDKQIRVKEEQIGELKDGAKKSERDRLNDELEKLKREKGDAEKDLVDVRQTGSSRASRRGGSGSGGGGFGSFGMGGFGSFGAKLPDRMGLDKGLAGFAEWGVDALMNIAAAPVLAELNGIAQLAGPTGPGGTTGLFGIAAANGMIPGFEPGAGRGYGVGTADLGTPFGAASIPALTSGAAPQPPAVPSTPAGGAAPLAPAAPGGTQRSTAIPAPAPGFEPPKPAGPATPAGDPVPRQGPLDIDWLKNAWQRVIGYGPFASPGGNRPAPMSPVEQAAQTAMGGPPVPVEQTPRGQGFLNVIGGPPTPGPGPVEQATQTAMGGPHIPAADLNKNQPFLTMLTGAPHFSTGGPSGTDTIPAWLGPDEMVMNKPAVDRWGPQLAFMNANHWDSGTPGPLLSDGSAPPADGGQAVDGASSQPADAGPQPDGGQPGGQSSSPDGAAPGPADGADRQPNVATPGDVTGYTGTAAPLSVMATPKQKTGIGKGIGMSGGGIIGAALSAGEGAGSMFAPGAGAAAALAAQQISRGIQYAGQMAGLAVTGLQQTLLPDLPMNGVLGKLLGGLAGAHPVTADTADQAQQGQGGYQKDGQQGGPSGGGGGPGGGGGLFGMLGPGQGAMTGQSAPALGTDPNHTTNNTAGDTVHHNGNEFYGPVTVQQQQDPTGLMGMQQHMAGMPL